MPREFDEIYAQTPKVKEIACKDCIFRDRTTLKVGKKELPVGVTKMYCEAYPESGDHSGKPWDVLFQNAECPKYASVK